MCNYQKDSKKNNKRSQQIRIVKTSNKGITLVALVVTIIVLIILAGITINIIMGQKGILTKAKMAKQEQQKAQATESLKLKMIDCQLKSVGEKGEYPTLAYLAAYLQKDKETIGDIEYVEAQSRPLASLDETPYIGWDKIYTKLAKYPYEFEIDSSFQVSVNGEQVSIPTGYMKIPTETKEITISENGTTTENVKDYANIKINVEVESSEITKPVLLWTNSSPTSNFGAQTISLDLSNYDYVIVTGKVKVKEEYLPRSSVIVPIGNYETYIMMGNSARGIEKTVRGVKATNSGVIFTDAYWGNDSPYKNYNIPLKIYGVKGDLGIDIFE